MCDYKINPIRIKITLKIQFNRELKFQVVVQFFVAQIKEPKECQSPLIVAEIKKVFALGYPIAVNNPSYRVK
jgi:hypothetical protein